MVSHQQIINIQMEVYNHAKFRVLKANKQLSEIVNNLLKAYLSIDAGEIPNEIKAIEEEIYKAEAKKSILLERKQELQKKIPKLTPQEIAEGWFINENDGKKYKRFDEE